MTSNPHFDAGAGEDAVMRGKGGEKQHVARRQDGWCWCCQEAPRRAAGTNTGGSASESTNTPPPAHATVDIAGLTRNRFVDAGRPGPCGCSMEARGVTAEPSAGRYYRGMSAGIPRVAITGIGVVSPFGVGRERFWQHSRGCSAHARDHRVRRLAVPLHGRRARAAGLRSTMRWRSIARVGRRSAVRRAPIRGAIRARRSSPSSRRREAWKDAGLRVNEPGAGVLVGSGAGGIDVAERQYFEFFNDGWKRVTPYAIPVSIVGMISSEISIALELHGISHVALDRLHELDRCHRLCRRAHPRGRSGRHPVGRRRRAA